MVRGQAEGAEEALPLDALTEDVQRREEGLREARRRLEGRREQAKREQEEALRRRKGELEREAAAAREEATRLRAEADEGERAARLQREEEERIGGIIRSLENESDLQQAAAARMRLDRVRAEREALDRATWAREVQLETIRRERERRDARSVDSLSNLLRSADTLRRELESGEYDAAVKTRIAGEAAEAAAAGGSEGGGGGFHVFDEVMARRRQRHEAEVERAEEEVRRLNRERQRLRRASAALARRRRVADGIRKKGVLVAEEMELGRAPPAKFVARNSGADGDFKEEEEDDDDDVDNDNEGEEGRALEPVEVTERRLERLRAERLRTARLLPRPSPVYKGELGESSCRTAAQAHLFRQLRGIVTDVLVPRAVANAERAREELDPEGLAVRALEIRAAQEESERRARAAARGRETAAAMAALLGEVVAEMAASVLAEARGKAAFAEQLARDAILRGVGAGTAAGGGTSRRSSGPVVAGLFAEMVRERDSKAAQGRARFAHRSLTAWLRPAEGGKSTKASASARKAREKRKKRREKAAAQGLPATVQALQEEAVDAEAEWLEREGAELLPIDAGEDEKVSGGGVAGGEDAAAASVHENPQEGHARFAAAEEAYWERVACARQPARIEAPNVKKAGAFAVAEPSRDGRFVAVGTTAGRVLVYRMLPPDDGRPPLLVRATPAPRSSAGRAAVVALAWDAASSSVVACGADGAAQVWRVTADPPELLERIEPSRLERPHSFPLAPGGCNAVVAAFAPGLTLAMRQPSVVLGTASGTVARWNRVHGESAVPLAGDMGDGRNGAGGHVHRREFFEAHRLPAVLVSPAPAHGAMLSADAGGTVCAWQRTHGAWSVRGCYRAVSTAVLTPLRAGGRLAQVASAVSGAEVVGLFRHDDGVCSLASVRLGGTEEQPRLARSPLAAEWQDHADAEVSFCCGPFMHCPGSDYAYALSRRPGDQHGVLRAVSMSTCRTVTAERVELPSLPPARRGGAPLRLAATSSGGHTVVLVPSASEPRVLAFLVADDNTPADRRAALPVRRPSGPREDYHPFETRVLPPGTSRMPLGLLPRVTAAKLAALEVCVTRAGLARAEAADRETASEPPYRRPDPFGAGVRPAVDAIVRGLVASAVRASRERRGLPT